MSKLPGPTLFSLFTNIGRIRKDPLAAAKKFLDDYGEEIELQIGWMHILAFNRTEHFDFFLRKQYQNFPKSDKYKTLSALMGQGLATADGDFWKNNRTRLQRIFHKQNFESYFQTVDKVALSYLNSLEESKVHNFYQDMMKFALASITSTLFDKDYSGYSQKISKALQVFMVGMEDRIFQVLPYQDKLPTKKNKQYNQAVQFLKDTVEDIIQEKEKEDYTNQSDLVSLLLSAQKDSPLIDREYIRDEVMTFYIAGHETTASAITWLVYLLGKNPEYLDKAREEVNQNFSGPYTYEQLEQSNILEQILNESLRLYPPLWMTSRQATKNVLFNDLKIKEGTIIVLSPYFLHRNQKYWQDPDKFYPERFEGKIIKDAFQPFSIGPRGCIGAGKEIAFELAKRGYHLILTARREGKLRMVAAEIEEKYNRVADIIIKDLLDDDAPEFLYQECKDNEIEVLVNNAGFGICEEFVNSDSSKVRDVLKLNIEVPTMLTQLFLKDMKKRNHGYILQIASIASFLPTPYYAVYGATKAYLRDFSDSLFFELKDTNIYHSVFNPGYTHTEFFEVSGQKMKKAQLRITQSPKDVACSAVEGLFARKRSKLPNFIYWYTANIIGKFVPKSLIAKWIMKETHM